MAHRWLLESTLEGKCFTMHFSTNFWCFYFVACMNCRDDIACYSYGPSPVKLNLSGSNRLSLDYNKPSTSSVKWTYYNQEEMFRPTLETAFGTWPESGLIFLTLCSRAAIQQSNPISSCWLCFTLRPSLVDLLYSIEKSLQLLPFLSSSLTPFPYSIITHSFSMQNTLHFHIIWNLLEHF